MCKHLAICVLAVIAIVHLLPPAVCNNNDLCKNKKLLCYDCDSQTNPNCQDPFNSTALGNMTRQCEGCCTKVSNYHPKANWTKRSCTENVINFSWLSRGCLKGVEGYIKVCVCTNESLCNRTSSVLQCHNFLINAVFALFTVIILFTC